MGAGISLITKFMPLSEVREGFGMRKILTVSCCDRTRYFHSTSPGHLKRCPSCAPVASRKSLHPVVGATFCNCCFRATILMSGVILFHSVTDLAYHQRPWLFILYFTASTTYYIEGRQGRTIPPMPSLVALQRQGRNKADPRSLLLLLSLCLTGDISTPPHQPPIVGHR
jgi:hypothetical protein